MQKLLTLLILALIFTGCGNDPITNAGYFDDDVDRSVTTNNSSNGKQVFNNYGTGNMNVTNNTGDTYIQYDKSIANTIAALSFDYNPSQFMSFLNVTNNSADTLWLKGTFKDNHGYYHSFELNASTSYMVIPPFETRSATDFGSSCITITSITFLNQVIDHTQECCPQYNYVPSNIWTGAIILGTCK